MPSLGDDVVVLHLPLESTETADGKPAPLPMEFRLFRFGENKSENGTFLFDKESAQSVLEAQKKWGNDYHADYEHATLQRKTDGPVPAACWYNLEVRDDGLWAKVKRWTSTAAKAISEHEYRYFSPAFKTVKNRVVKIINAGLTNLPALNDLEPLTALSQAEGEVKMFKLLSLLGLEENATEEVAIKALKKAMAASHCIQELTKSNTDEEAVAIVESWKKKAKKFKKLKKKLLKARDEHTRKEVAALIADGIKSGKIAPAQQEFAETLGAKDPDALRLFLKNQKAVSPIYRKHTEVTPTEAAKTNAETVTASDLPGDADKIRRMIGGVSPEVFLKVMEKRQGNEADPNAGKTEMEALEQAVTLMTKDSDKHFFPSTVQTGKES